MTTSDEATPPASSPKRRRLRLSLRGLMVAVLIIGVFLGLVVRRANVQRDAVAAIVKTGGRVLYDWEWPRGGMVNLKAQPIWPRWLVDRLGPDYFGHVVEVWLGTTATDAEMEQAGRLPKLRAVNCPGAKGVTDVGVAHLAGLAELENVGLQNTGVTGAGLSHLRGKTGLRFLLLKGLPITDQDLTQIERMTDLDALDLRDTKVTDAGLVHLAGLVHVRQLILDSTPIAGPGLIHLKGMNELIALSLRGSRVHDLTSLPPLPALRRLNLSGTTVEDPDLEAVVKLPVLQQLMLDGTGVTDEGLRSLTRLKSSLKILFLDETRLTDAAASTLADLENLEVLSLARTGITDLMLNQFKGLKNLKNLDLDGTATTDAGLSRLKQSLPKIMTTAESQVAARAMWNARANAAAKTPTTKAGSQP